MKTKTKGYLLLISLFTAIGIGLTYVVSYAIGEPIHMAAFAVLLSVFITGVIGIIVWKAVDMIVEGQRTNR